MKKHNQYFNIFKTSSDTPGELITPIRVIYDEKIWEKINSEYLDTEKWKITSIFNLDIKSYIRDIFPDVYNSIKELVLRNNRINLDDDCFSVCLGTLSDYRKINEQFDNELSFLEYMNSEISDIDKNRPITNTILERAGFENITKELDKEYYKNEFNIDNYVSYTLCTNDIDDKNSIKIDVDNGLTNSDRKWRVHIYIYIDNKYGYSIGNAEIDTVYQFNLFMKLFDSKFRL